MTPLNHREWLETIVATGSQRSGFAQDALRELDELQEAAADAEPSAALLADVDDALDGLPGGSLVKRAESARDVLTALENLTGREPDMTMADDLRRIFDTFFEVQTLMERAGVIEPGGDVSVDILAMFLPA